MGENAKVRPRHTHVQESQVDSATLVPTIPEKRTNKTIIGETPKIV